MKQIANKTILKQGDKTYYGVETKDCILWYGKEQVLPVAQSRPKLKGIPVISLNSYVNQLGKKHLDKNHNNEDIAHPEMYDGYNSFIEGYKSNHNQFTLKDIEKAVELARVKDPHNVVDGEKLFEYSIKDIHDRINSISVIEVDEQFNILSYE